MPRGSRSSMRTETGATDHSTTEEKGTELASTEQNESAQLNGEVKVETDSQSDEQLATENDQADDERIDINLEQELPDVDMNELVPLPEEPGLNEEESIPHTMRKDRDLVEFLGMMDQYAPVIPDAVTDYYLSLAGFESGDVRIKRLLALATQKFIADIAQDAYQYSRIRSSGQGSGGMGGRRAGGKAVLTMEDLRGAMGEMGADLRRAEFYR